jgi:hypothetical protein
MGREDGARTRFSQHVDVIGSFTLALLAGVRQFDHGPQRLRPGVNIEDLSQDGFYDVECVPEP